MKVKSKAQHSNNNRMESKIEFFIKEKFPVRQLPIFIPCIPYHLILTLQTTQPTRLIMKIVEKLS